MHRAAVCLLAVAVLSTSICRTRALHSGVFTRLKPARLALLQVLHQLAELDVTSSDRLSWWSLKGDAQLAPLQMATYFTVASSSKSKNICQVTVNAGHSAAVFLSAHPEVKYWGFDQLLLPYSNRSIAALKRMFSGRVEIIPGAPDTTLPSFTSRGITCDVFALGGRHDYNTARSDLDNAIKVMQPGGIIIADEASGTCPGCLKAWQEFVAEGHLSDVRCAESPTLEGQWVKHWCHGVVTDPKTSGTAKRRMTAQGSRSQAGNTTTRRLPSAFKYGMLTTVEGSESKLSVKVSSMLSALLDGLTQIAEATILEKDDVARLSLQHGPQTDPLQVADYARLASYSLVSNICEVGFNGGHSASIFLSANPTARYWGFDPLKHPYSSKAAEAVKRMFPNRAVVKVGDPAKTVSEFRKGVVCDVFSVAVSGGNYSAVRGHISDALQVMHPVGILVVQCVGESVSGCQKAWEEVVSEGKLVNAQCSEGQVKGGRRWCYASVSKVSLPESVRKKVEEASPVDVLITYCQRAFTVEHGGKLFPASIRVTVPDAKLIIFADQICAELLDPMDMKHVTMIPPGGNTHPIMWRFHVWTEHLRQYSKRYRYLITADIRDVVFQSNPFPALARLHNMHAKGEKSIVFVHEEALPGDDKDYPNGPLMEKVVEGGRKWNTIWVKECFGEQVAKRIGDLPALNAGCVSGTALGVLTWILKMHEIKAQHCPGLDEMGPDQAINIFMGHTSDWNSTGLTMKVIPNGELVLNMVLLDYAGWPVKLDSNGQVVSPYDGRVYHMLHQYDRAPQVLAAVSRRWNKGKEMQFRGKGNLPKVELG